MLSPDPRDPNYKEEKKRKEREPDTFGNREQLRPRPGDLGRLPPERRER